MSSVNGKSCSYVKLGRYSNCSSAEVANTPSPSTSDYVNKGALPNTSQNQSAQSSAQVAPVNPTMVGSNGQPISTPVANPSAPKIGVTEGFYADEGKFVPHYNVPNYAPINTNSLTYGGNCAGYPNILQAYGSDAGNCVTNFIQN